MRRRPLVLTSRLFRHEPAGVRFFAVVAVAASCCALSLSRTSFSQQPASPAQANFVHVPLQYDGPDPTERFFLPETMQSRLLGVSNSAWPAELDGSPTMAGPYGMPLSDVAKTADDECPPLSDHKDGFFQRAGFTATWLNRGDDAGFGVTELDFLTAFALPLPRRDWPLIISPTFNWRLLDGPETPDLPSQLYEGYVDFVWLPQFTPRWQGILSVAPSLYGDFSVSTSDAWRLTGRGLVRFDWIPDHLELLAGVLYLNREDVKLLPAGGLIWKPAPDRRYEIVFPRPRFARRFHCGPVYQDWAYLGFEFGGNSYAFERSGVVDTVTLRDYRGYLGWERKMPGGAGLRVEAGYVISRTAEFVSGLPKVHGDDAVHLRFGAAY